MKQNTKNLVLAAMFLAIGLVLPFFTGQIPQIGSMLLPMHLPVLLCGLLCGCSTVPGPRCLFEIARRAPAWNCSYLSSKTGRKERLMNVLLVDDQVRILSGLISGLDWQLWVSRVSAPPAAPRRQRLFYCRSTWTSCCAILRCQGRTDFLCCAGTAAGAGLCLRFPHFPCGLSVCQGSHPTGQL